MRTPDAPFRVEESQAREVARLIEEGLLERLLPGVVGPTGCSRDADVRANAAVLALPDRLRRHGVLAQAAAAWVWCGGDPPRVVDVAVEPGRAVPRAPLLATHERRLSLQDVALLPAGGTEVTVGDRLALTTTVRTVTDLLRLLPEPEALVVAAPLIALPAVTADAVRACLERMPRARGVPRVRRLLEELPFGQSMRLPVIR